AVREALTKEVCQDVEVIGWLYQFYISEKKDEVINRRGKVAKDEIPAATQLFTPEWIVRFIVQNSLGRLWLLNNPKSRIRSQMEYYIPPAMQETDFLKVETPEELKILDPACGSGHILTYAFDLLYAIYEEMGYDPITIPRFILEKNLYGVEIDKRAAMLASFALMMKAVEKDRRFFTRKLQPNILEMEDISFDTQEVKAYMSKVGENLWTQELWEGLHQFENAKTFGSLIRPALKDVSELRARLEAKGVFEDLFLSKTNEKVQKVLKMAEYLSPRYHVVVANPPYFSKGMDGDYKQFAKDNYPESKRDTLTMFMERNLELSLKSGYVGMVTLMSWMFLTSFETFRKRLIKNETILTMAHLGARAFDTISGEVVSTTMFSIKNQHCPDYSGVYIRLVDGCSEIEKSKKLKVAISNPNCGWFFRVSTADFKKIPGAPIAYWVSDQIFQLFLNSKSINEYCEPSNGIQTGNNSKYIRFWFEVEKKKRDHKWIPYNKGGPFRKWYGDDFYYINWDNYGFEIRAENNSSTSGEEFYFKEGITWSDITSAKTAFRYFPKGHLFDHKGPSAFPNDKKLIRYILGYLNTKITYVITKILNPTLSFQIGNFRNIPIKIINSYIEDYVNKLIKIHKCDWDSFETSWNFNKLSLLNSTSNPNSELLSMRFKDSRKEWQRMVNETQQLEEEINQNFIDAYGIHDELSNEIPVEEITLTCNPHYRYGGNYTDAELETRLLEDTMKEFISCSVGCMFGRYSLDKPGLILANQGDTTKDYYKALNRGEGIVTFPPTETNVLPILEGEWFADDILAQFKRFLRVTFGEENFAENLRFIEDALGKNLQKYFLRDFYKDHVKMYKKRPIYWLFSSPKGSFNALIYMHRYTPETVSVVLNQYLREYRDKLTAHRNNLERISTAGNASARDKSQALKEIEKITKILAELKEYEDEVLYPLASQQIEIDLDDGVKVNYAKFGKALKKI
ncbi:MAG: BREX-1 system adenine-specific DNA-methyltransferase PglX, partial [Candidatus Helarchaeota archaeon]